MKLFLCNIGLLLVSLCTLSGCFEIGTDIFGPFFHSNLIDNGSFEKDGYPTSFHWSGFEDTSRVRFATDVPAGGGKYSARLWNDCGAAGIISTTIPADAGYHFYRLSVLAKSSMAFQRAQMVLYIQRNQRIVREKAISISDTLWTQSSLLDTLATTLGDTIGVTLLGDYSQWSSGYTFVDLVSLVRVW